MNAVKTDVIIPAYHPGEEFDKLLERLSAQKYPVNKIIVMNTEKKFWRENWEQKYPLVEVHHLTKQEFDHGATRRRGAELSDAEILIFMTQDALPADRNLVGNLVQAVAGNEQERPMHDSFPKMTAVSLKNIPVRLIIRSSPALKQKKM